ncbi:hypothetical protein D1872_293700 [compost metagenome]
MIRLVRVTKQEKPLPTQIHIVGTLPYNISLGLQQGPYTLRQITRGIIIVIIEFGNQAVPGSRNPII